MVMGGIDGDDRGDDGRPGGDRAGIVLRALQSATVMERCTPVVVGHAETLRRCAEAIGLAG